MVSKEHRKIMQKSVSQKQEKVTKKNNTLINNFSEEIDFNNLSEFNGVRAYVLLRLSKIIDNLRSGKKDDTGIREVALELERFAEEPEKSYNNYIRNNIKSMSKENLIRAKWYLNNAKYNLNTTERTLLKFQMQAVLLGYVWRSENELIDYGAIKVSFELSYQAIFLGLEERKINSLDIYVGYEDTLSYYKVMYCDTNDKYDDLEKETFLMPNWISLDELYHRYSIYKHQYINFEESSLKSMAAAYVSQKEYDSRTNGRDLLTYNGLALNYFTVLEKELKKLITQNFNIKYNKLTLEDAINLLKEGEFIELSKEKIICQLHKMRKLRNEVAHGYNISYEEYHDIYNTFIENQVFKYISWNLKYKNWDNPEYQLEQGVKYFNGDEVEQNYEEALKWFIKSAEQGNDISQNWLGYIYREGIGTKRNIREALNWYEKSAEQGNVSSQNELGHIYAQGLGVEINYKEAFKWFQKAAELGDDVSQGWLGQMYVEGNGTKKNYSKALMWYIKSAEQGNNISQNDLGCMYAQGLGVKIDYKEAFSWFTKAAEQGNSSSQCYLGRMYYEGLGVKRNYNEALKWYIKSSKQGNVEAIESLKYFENIDMFPPKSKTLKNG